MSNEESSHPVLEIKPKPLSARAWSPILCRPGNIDSYPVHLSFNFEVTLTSELQRPLCDIRVKYSKAPHSFLSLIFSSISLCHWFFGFLFPPSSLQPCFLSGANPSNNQSRPKSARAPPSPSLTVKASHGLRIWWTWRVSGTLWIPAHRRRRLPKVRPKLLSGRTPKALYHSTNHFGLQVQEPLAVSRPCS